MKGEGAPETRVSEPPTIVQSTAEAAPDPSPTSADTTVTDLPGGGELASLASLDDADGARAWFNARLHAFATALSHDQAGRLRPETERQALAQAARDMVERLVSRRPAGAASDWPAEATLQPGQLLANTFHVRALIARGGVGEVYRVRHRDLRTEHAVKILQPQHMLDTTLASMLMDEGRILLRLRHPGVVAGHGLIRDGDGRLLMVMEFVRGSTLAARLRDGPLDAAELTALATGLLTALGGLHGEGVVHGDLSPDNIMLEEDRCAAPKLIDFGVAHIIGPADEAAILVDFAGKFSWVSPEQLRGAGQAIDGRSDLYSLGLVLAAASRGRKLDMGSDHGTATAARRGAPALDGVPPAWAAILQCLLAPSPDQRPPNAAAAMALLTGCKPVRRSLLAMLRRG